MRKTKRGTANLDSCAYLELDFQWFFSKKLCPLTREPRSLGESWLESDLLNSKFDYLMLRNKCFESKSGKKMRQRCINQSYVLQYGFEDDKWKYWTDRIHTECHTQSILSKAETNSTRTVEEKRGQNGLQWSIVISRTKDKNYISKLPNIISQFLFILINYSTFFYENFTDFLMKNQHNFRQKPHNHLSVGKEFCKQILPPWNGDTFLHLREDDMFINSCALFKMQSIS